MILQADLAPRPTPLVLFQQLFHTPRIVAQNDHVLAGTGQEKKKQGDGSSSSPRICRVTIEMVKSFCSASESTRGRPGSNTLDAILKGQQSASSSTSKPVPNTLIVSLLSLRLQSAFSGD